MKRLALVGIWIIGFVGTLAAHAGRLAEVVVTDRDSGARLETHYYHGEYWVAGQPGARYAVSIRNRLGERLLAVTSVDGINVISGQTASWDQGGYVLDPGEEYQITGWRKSDYQVAAFAFTALPDSYAARTGRPQNVGVIGIALFRERPLAYVAPPRLPEIARERAFDGAAGSLNGSTSAQTPAQSKAAPSAAAASSPLDSQVGHGPSPSPPAARAERPSAPSSDLNANAMNAPPVTQSLGTAHGQREYSYVAHTTFVRRQPQPDEIIRIRYDSFENLVAMGIVQPYHYGGVVRPNPFPSSQQYVPDPPGELVR